MKVEFGFLSDEEEVSTRGSAVLRECRQDQERLKCNHASAVPSYRQEEVSAAGNVRHEAAQH